MRRILNRTAVILFVLAGLVLGWGGIIKAMNELTFSGVYHPQGFYMSMAHL